MLISQRVIRSAFGLTAVKKHRGITHCWYQLSFKHMIRPLAEMVVHSMEVFLDLGQSVRRIEGG